MAVFRPGQATRLEMDARVLRLLGEREIRCGDQNRRAKAAELLEGAHQRQRALVVHVAGRLVREQQIGPADDGARDRSEERRVGKEGRSRGWREWWRRRSK